VTLLNITNWFRYYTEATKSRGQNYGERNEIQQQIKGECRFRQA